MQEIPQSNILETHSGSFITLRKNVALGVHKWFFYWLKTLD